MNFDADTYLVGGSTGPYPRSPLPTLVFVIQPETFQQRVTGEWTVSAITHPSVEVGHPSRLSTYSGGPAFEELGYNATAETPRSAITVIAESIIKNWPDRAVQVRIPKWGFDYAEDLLKTQTL